MFSEYFAYYECFPYELEPITPRREPAKQKTKPAGAEEMRVRQHPTWQRLEDAIIRALGPFAEARNAVCLALDAIEPLPVGT